MTRETKGDRTKKQLYDCAVALFREKGYQNVSVEEIAKAAGMAKGTFYIYFQSKSSIIGALIRQYDDYYESVYADLDHSLPVEQQLNILIAKSCEFTQTVIGLDLIRVLYENQLRMQPREQEAMDINRPLYQLVTKLIQLGQQQGVYDSKEDPMHLTLLLMRCLRGTYYEWCMQAGGFDLISEGLDITRQLLRSFQAAK